MLTLEACWQKIPPKLSLKYLKQNMKNQTIFELYTDDNKTKYSSNPIEILKSAKKCYETQHEVNFHSCYYWIYLQNA